MVLNLQVAFPAAPRGPRVVLFATAAPPNLKPYVEKLVSGASLTKQEAAEVCAAVLVGAEPMQVASCLMLMRRNGESPAEVAGFVQAMSDACVPVKVRRWVNYERDTRGCSSSSLLGSVNSQPSRFVDLSLSLSLPTSVEWAFELCAQCYTANLLSKN